MVEFPSPRTAHRQHLLFRRLPSAGEAMDVESRTSNGNAAQLDREKLNFQNGDSEH